MRRSGEKAGRNKPKSKIAASQTGGAVEEKQAATSQNASMRPAREAEERMKGRLQQVKKQECGLPGRRRSGGKAGRNKLKSRYASSQSGGAAEEKQAAPREKARMRPPR